MVLNDVDIHNWASRCVEPFVEAHINPASLDLTLGPIYIDLQSGESHNLVKELTLEPGKAILASTVEYIKMPEDCAGVLYLKSSLARQGLDHALAGWIDPGFHGQITLELHTHRTIILRPGQRICQIVLQRMEEPPAKSYKVTGRYNGQQGPTEAR